MKVWVTRAEPEAGRTAKALIAAGHQPLVSPLIQVRVLPAAKALAKALTGVSAVAFTSANGVRAFAALRPISDRHLTAFTVGDATARAAREAGFVRVISAGGDVVALAKRIAAKSDRPSGVVLKAGGLAPAGDLIGDLERRGVSARAVAVYQTAPLAPSPAALAALDRQPPGVDVVLIHSPSAGRELAGLLAERPGLSEALSAVCISKAAAEPLKAFKFARRAVAQTPDEAAMFARLQS